MTHFVRRVPVFLIALVAGATVALAQQASRPTRPELPPRDSGAVVERATATGVIAGTVTAADTGRPLRRVNVVVQRLGATGGSSMSLLPGAERSLVTDDQGRFELADLPAGRWRITASRNGYMTQQLGQRRPFEIPPPVILADGQRFAADMSLARASAINGRVVDEYGDPLAGVRVQLLRPRMSGHRRYLQPVGPGDLSDDTGAYRLYGLPPGEYYISASIRVAPIDSVVQTTYLPTYFPGTGNFAEAQRVFVAAATEINADFPVRPIRAARISGIVLTNAGAPAEAFLNLVSEAAEQGSPVGVGGATRDDGTFTLPDIAPGAYTLHAALRNGGLDAEATSMPITIYGDDVSGITLITTPPASMRVSLLPDAGVQQALPASVDIVARTARAGHEMRHGAAGRVSSEPMTLPPGPFYIEPEIPEGWTLKAVVVNDIEMTDGPIDLKGQQNVPVRLVLTDKVTEISGSITIDRPDRSVSVVVFPEDSGKWTPPSRFVRTAAVNERGAFRVAGLPGGVRYLAVALEGLEEGEGHDPDVLLRIRDHAVSFPLAEGERLALGLAVVSR